MRRSCRLDSLQIVTPCAVPWSSMKGDDAVRFCGQRRKNVYNVAGLGRAEADQLYVLRDHVAMVRRRLSETPPAA